MELKEKARKLPQIPGVYLMKDSYGNIIYVGKAKNLKNRVSQYFQSSNRHSPKIVRMIENIDAFDHITADSELEALLLECRLIKDLKPMYNSQMKNDRGYVYLRLNKDEEFPSFEILQERAEGAVCFGPYSSQKSVERALEVLQDSFKLRSCRSFASRKSGCLRQQLGLCMSPCAGGASPKEYSTQIGEAIAFLEGRSLGLLADMQSRMEAAAEALDFGKAAKCRDDLRALRRLVGRQQAVGFTQQNRCIAAVEKLDESTYKLFILQGTHISYKAMLETSDLDYADLKELIISSIIIHATDCSFGDFGLDKQEVDQAHIVYSYLKNKKSCSYVVIPESWLKGKNQSKLEKAALKLAEKVLN